MENNTKYIAVLAIGLIAAGVGLGLVNQECFNLNKDVLITNQQLYKFAADQLLQDENVHKLGEDLHRMAIVTHELDKEDVYVKSIVK